MPSEASYTRLAARLNNRRSEIEQAAITRVFGIADPREIADPEYMEGLRMAVAGALDYAIAALPCDTENLPPIPTALLSQARLAVRNHVGLDVVLRRYLAGYSLLGDFLIEEAQGEGLFRGAELKRLLRAQAARFDRLLAMVSEEYAREAAGRIDSAEQRRAARIERLLAGELLDASDLAYDFNDCHLGVVAAGPSPVEAIQLLAGSFDCQLLLVRRGDGTVWAWMASRRALDPAELERLTRSKRLDGLVLAIGELGEGLAGWRFSHRQARAALPVALRSPGTAIRYTDVALLASMLQDDLLATSLRKLYLEPLEQGRDRGESARQTLRAYIAAERHVTSAAAALGVNRNTVANRLRMIEEQLGRPLATCVAEIETALRLEELRSGSSTPNS